MAEWRTLGADDIRVILRSFGIAAYQTHRPIPVGTINTNVRVETGAETLFLRVNEGKSLDDVAREAAIVAHAAARGVPTPAPLRALTGEPFLLWPHGGTTQIISLFPWVPGRTLQRVEVTPAHAAAVGAALAHLHRAGADFTDHRPGRYEPDEIDRRLARIRGLGRPELADAIAILMPELRGLTRDRAADLPLGLIHGDLFVDNVLYETQEPWAEGSRTRPRPTPLGEAQLPPREDGPLTALLDFEQASWGRLVYDLAVTTLAFAFGRDDFRPELTRALLDAYSAVRLPTAAERAAFGAELRFVACRFAVTRITDVHLKQGPGAPPGKRFQRYLDRLAAVKSHLAASDGLLAL